MQTSTARSCTGTTFEAPASRRRRPAGGRPGPVQQVQALGACAARLSPALLDLAGPRAGEGCVELDRHRVEVAEVGQPDHWRPVFAVLLIPSPRVVNCDGSENGSEEATDSGCLSRRSNLLSVMCCLRVPGGRSFRLRDTQPRSLPVEVVQVADVECRVPSLPCGTCLGLDVLLGVDLRSRGGGSASTAPCQEGKRPSPLRLTSQARSSVYPKPRMVSPEGE